MPSYIETWEAESAARKRLLGDREKLAREMRQDWMDGDEMGDEACLAFADIAIAYADRRVAEFKAAVEACLYQCSGADADILRRALRPAREGGSDE